MEHLGRTQDTSSDSQHHVSPRRLLPALVENVDVYLNPTRSTPSIGRPKMVNAACKECRMRKVKCSGNRPKCRGCITRRTQCVYDTANVDETQSEALRRKHIKATHENQSYHELYQLLQTISEVEAQQILLQIRLGTDIERLLRHVRDAEMLLQISPVPGTTRHYAFPYITKMPASLLQPTTKNPYLGSLLYDAAFNVKNTPLSSAANPQPTRVSYVKPFHATRLVYPLLYKVQASRWTAVNSNDELLRALLQAYIIHEYPTYPAIHLDLFLQAMESPIVSRKTLCSPLLVNTILAIACQCYKRTPNQNEFWNPQTLGYRFLAEAKRLWELECDTTAITTLQAAILLHAMYGQLAMDELGQPFLLKAITMAHDLELFQGEIPQEDRQMKLACEYTAWCLFASQQLGNGFFYGTRGLIKAIQRLSYLIHFNMLHGTGICHFNIR